MQGVHFLAEIAERGIYLIRTGVAMKSLIISGTAFLILAQEETNDPHSSDSLLGLLLRVIVAAV
jgi:hypothetical protein